MEVKRMSDMSDEQSVIPLPPSRPQNNLKGGIDIVVSLLSLALIASIIMFLVSWFNVGYLVLAVIIFFAASCINSIQVVQPPEIWIIEQFGQWSRNIGPGVHWIIPWIETVREKLQLYEQSIDGFLSIREIVFRDGPAKLLNPKLWYELNEASPQDAIYKVSDYRKWAEAVIGPIIRGYLNTLNIDDGLDQGAARGDILEKMRTRPDVTDEQITQIKGFIRKITKKINDVKNSRDASLLEAARDAKEDDKRTMEALLANQIKARTELKNFEDQAEKLGFKKINRFTVGEFLISDELKKSREAIHKARKDMIAAVSNAITEATMRTEPVVQAKARFEQIGFSPEEAREKAFQIEIIETLAKSRSLFLTGGQGNIQAVAAQVAAIFTETTQRRKEAETASKTETTT